MLIAEIVGKIFIAIHDECQSCEVPYNLWYTWSMHMHAYVCLLKCNKLLLTKFHKLLTIYPNDSHNAYENYRGV